MPNSRVEINAQRAGQGAVSAKYRTRNFYLPARGHMPLTLAQRARLP